MAKKPIPEIARNYDVAPIPVTGQLRAGAGRVDITPALGLAMAGYSFFFGPYARCVWGRLQANVLLVDDGAGERVAFITTDLHAGTRYLVERLAERVAPTTGLSIDRIVLAASHTHGGPGHIYGARHADAMVANGKGFDLTTTEYLVKRIAEAVEAAHLDLQPARIGYGSHPCWGYLINRSLRAAVRNIGVTGPPPYSASDTAKIRNLACDLNEQPPPADLPLAHQVVDARVHCIWAGKAAADEPIGVFAILATHPCLTTKRMKIMTPDSFGVAAKVAREKLWDRFHVRVPVGVAGGAQGDSNLVVPGMDLGTILEVRKDQEVARRMAEDAGRAVGEALVDAAEKARQNSLIAAELQVCFDEVSARSAWVNDVGKFLAHLPQFGIPVMGASEFNRGITSLIFREGMRRWRYGDSGDVEGADPHYPKLLMPCLLRLIRNHRGGSPATVFPIRAIRVGEVWFATVPGEPTSGFGLAVRNAIRSVHNTPDAPVVVVGISGEYCGYVTMPEEYDAQHYEGASTVWGRLQGLWLVDRIERMARCGTREVPGFGTTAKFEGFLRSKRCLPPTLLNHDPFGHARRRFQVSVETRTNTQGHTRQVLRFEGEWEAGPHDALEPLGAGPWVVLEWNATTGYEALEWKGERVDDQTFPFLITRKASLFHITWKWELEMDWDPTWEGREVRFLITAPKEVKGDGSEYSPTRVIPAP
jgi:neutral ceramidase